MIAKLTWGVDVEQLQSKFAISGQSPVWRRVVSSNLAVRTLSLPPPLLLAVFVERGVRKLQKFEVVHSWTPPAHHTASAVLKRNHRCGLGARRVVGARLPGQGGHVEVGGSRWAPGALYLFVLVCLYPW